MVWRTSKYSYLRKQTAMSHVDSKDDDAKEIYSLVKSDDSKESDKPKKDIIPIKDEDTIKDKKSDEFNDYEYSDKDPLEDKLMDDSEW